MPGNFLLVVQEISTAVILQLLDHPNMEEIIIIGKVEAGLEGSKKKIIKNVTLDRHVSVVTCKSLSIIYMSAHNTSYLTA